MRVCHVLESTGGGSARVVYELAHFGLTQGDEVTVINAPDRADPAYIAKLAELKCVRLLASSMKREIGWSDFWDALSLFLLLRKEGPFDIIHAHSSKAGALARLVGLFLRGKVVYTPHAFYSMTPGTSPLYGWIEKALSWLAPCVVAVSLAEFKHGQKLGISKAKLFMIPNGSSPSFPLSRDEARRALKVSSGVTVFGFVGRLASQKNPLRAVAAFAPVVREYPQSRLVIIGDGPLREAVETECLRLNIRQHVDMLGACEARPVIPGFDCLINSSDFEGMPITFLECLSAGVAIIAPPVGGTDEAVVHGVTGFLARDFSAKALAEAMRFYLTLAPEARRKMSADMKERSKMYTAEMMGGKYRSLYLLLLSAKRESTPTFTNVGVPSARS